MHTFLSHVSSCRDLMAQSRKEHVQSAFLHSHGYPVLFPHLQMGLYFHSPPSAHPGPNFTGLPSPCSHQGPLTLLWSLHLTAGHRMVFPSLRTPHPHACTYCRPLPASSSPSSSCSVSSLALPRTSHKILESHPCPSRIAWCLHLSVALRRENIVRARWRRRGRKQVAVGNNEGTGGTRRKEARWQ